MIQRAFTPFDLQLPKKGDDKGKKWSQKGSPMVFQQSGSEGTAGGVSLKHKVASRDGETVRVESSGRAAVIPGNTVEMGTNSMLRINSTGNTQFNTALGLMDWALVSTDSDHAVSNMAGLSMVKPDSFKVSLGRISESGALLKPPPEPKPETP